MNKVTSVILAAITATAHAELVISDLLDEGYSTGRAFELSTVFSGADNAVCTSGKGVDISTSLTLSDA